jgi:DNA-directed RNA polymerase specialized sigma subunit
MKEEFKDVKSYEGIYQISNFGNIKSLEYKKGKTLKVNKNSRGYFCVGLYKNGIQKTLGIHRLIAVAFILNPENKKTVNHKNGIKADNRLENLEWVSYSENIQHAYNMGLNNNSGEEHRLSKLTEKEVLQIRDLCKYKRFTQKEIGIIYNCHNSTISRIVTQKIWKHILKNKKQRDEFNNTAI